MSYSDYLQSSHWKETRKGILNIHENKCQVCSSTENLHVHHKRYKSPIMRENILGKEKHSHLCVLCRNCHAQWHAIYKKRETNAKNIRYANILFELGATRKNAFIFCTQVKVIEELLKTYKKNTDNRIIKYIGNFKVGEQTTHQSIGTSAILHLR